MPDRATVTRHSSFVDLLRERAERHPQRPAFVFMQEGTTESESWSYAELDQRARAIAAQLQRRGLKGERALLLYNPGLDFVAGFFGCLYANVTAVPAYPPRSNALLSRLAGIIRDADVALALTASVGLEGIVERLRDLEAIRPPEVIATDTFLAEDGGAWHPPAIAAEDLAFLQYTSGSTGQPKGVMVSHANLLHNSGLINLCFEDSERSIGVSWLPPYHDMGLVGGILQSLYAGSTTYLMPPVSFLQRPIRWLEAISRHGATTAGGPNFAYEFCARQIRPEQREGLDLSRWTLAFTGAEPVRQESLDLFCSTFEPCGFRREAFLSCYGLAENTLIVSGGNRRQAPVVRFFDGPALRRRRVVELPGEGGGSGRPLVSCGAPVGEVGIEVVDPETGRALGPGQIGEIWVSGGSVAQGYRLQPERSRATFGARLEEGGVPYLRTGDLGFLLDGELYVNGRLKDLIIIRGSNHYPQDIEATVESAHGALRIGCGAAFAVEENGEERLVVVHEVERSALRRLDADEVTAAIRAAVVERHQLVPSAILLLKTGAIPKTSSGKIQRFACRQRYEDGSFEPVGSWRQAAQAPPAAAPEPAGLPGGEGPPPPRSSSAGLSPEERRIHAWFRQYLAAQLGLAAAEIDVDRPLAQYGLDSMAAVRLSADLDDWFATTFADRPRQVLSPTLAYDHPTIARLATALLAGDGAGLAEAGPLAASAAADAHGQDGRELRDDDIAVVGLACRFPGAPSPEALWQLLRQGGDGIRRAEEADALDRGFGAPPAPQGGFLDGIDRFDAAFFGIGEREADQMDPQQRVLLETTWEAFERAGIAPDRWAGSRAGVFVGISSSDYAQLQPQQATSVYWGTGNAHSIAANRLSYLFDLRGPSLAVDTACSSSLVAVHQAVRSLQLGECQQAIAAGINILLMPALTETFRQAGMLAPDGRCKPFAADADGYGRSEGCGVVLLKRLEEARRDGDRVWGVIAGSAVNQDGRSNGLTAPNGQAQQEVVREALERSGIRPAAISYVEAHGTGTPLGDPIEVNALRAVLTPGRSAEQPCWLGSVKGNLGHLEAAAGMAGLIKVLLCFAHGELPPHRQRGDANPLLQLERSPFRLNTAPQAWGGPGRWAGVSSFGFGGTNAHLVLTAPAPDLAPALAAPHPPRAERPCHLLTLSAHSAEALAVLRRRHARLLADPQRSAQQLADHCYSANVGRSHLVVRQAWVGASGRELAAALEGDDGSARPGNGSAPSLAFLFTGQGCQYPGMAGELLESQPSFRREIDACSALLAEEQVLPEGLAMADLLRQPEGEAERQRRAALLENTALTQPLLFCLEVALARLWMDWGVQPDWLMGHSVGEYAAACVAGVFDRPDGVRLMAARARLMAALPPGGGMLAVFADAATVAHLLQERGSPLVVAADNGPANVVLSGSLAALADLAPELEARNLAARPLRVSHAFHSPLMEPMLAPFREVAAAIRYREPQLPILSNLSGEPIGAAMADADYWCRHVMAPVAFGAGLSCLHKQGVEVFLEIGPKPTLVDMGRGLGLDPGAHWLASLRPDRPASRQMLESLAQLYRLGTPIDWVGFDAPFPRRRVALPTYPWQGRRHWLASVRPSLSPLSLAGGRPEAGPGQVSVAAGAGAAMPAAPAAREPGLFIRQWRPQPPPTAPSLPAAPGLWLVCGPRWLAVSLAAALPAEQRCAWVEEQEGGACRRIQPHHWQLDPSRCEHWQQLLQSVESEGEQGLPLLGLLQLAQPQAGEDADGALQAVEARLRRSERLPALVQALLAQRWPSAPPRLWWLSSPPPGDRSDPQAALEEGLAEGFGLCLALEHPALWGGWLEIAALDSPQGMADLLGELGPATAIASGLSPAGGARRGSELRVRLNCGARLVRRLAPLQPLADAAERSRSQPATSGTPAAQGGRAAIPDGQVLISGGFGALGMATAEWLVARGVPSLILVGRHGPSAAVEERLQAWRRQGVAVTSLEADVGSADFLPRIRAVLEASSLPLRGIIHAAGLLEDASIERLEAASWERVLRPKIVGAWQLHQLSREHPVELFVLYSSLAALLGSPGQAAYGAANAALDGLARCRRQLGLPALSLNWGPWSGRGIAQQGRERSGRALEDVGIEALPAAVYLQRLEALLVEGAGEPAAPAVVAVAQMQLGRLAALFSGRPQAALLAEMAPVTPTPGAFTHANPPGEPPLRARLLALAPQARQQAMLAYLQETLARLLGTDRGAIEPDLHLMEAAADSLMVMDAISQIQTDLGLMIYPREIYEHPRVGDLARYLAAAFQRSLGQEASTVTPAPAAALPAALRLPPSLAARAAGSAPQAGADRLRRAVFVLSSPRAGSTLLRVMLAGHRQLFSPPELHLLPFATMGERARALDQSFLGEGLERALMELEGIDAPASRALVRGWEAEERSVASVYARMQGLAGERILVDKSPTYALHGETLQRAEADFDQPLYIHLVRHPYAVIRSFVDLRMDQLFGMQEGDPYRLAETIWRTCNQNVLDLQRHLGEARVHRLHYEDLVSQPEATLTNLCAFLGIPFEPALLSPYEGQRLTDGTHQRSLSVGDPNFGRHRRIEASLAEAWREAKLPWSLEGATRQLAEGFGYRLPDPASAALPPAPPAAGGLERREAMVEVQGRQLCCCEWGPPGGPPVLCLHGLLDQGLIWEPVALGLAAAGYRVIAPDLRGHGRSAHAGSYQPLDFIGDAVALVDRLVDRPFQLIGHSLGSVVACGLASLRETQVERLVLIEPVLPALPGSQPVRETVDTLVHYALSPPRHSPMPDQASALARLRRAMPSLPLELAQRLVGRVIRPEGEGWIWCWDPVLQTRMSLNLQSGPLHRAAYLQLLAELRTSCTVVQGASSAFNRPEDLQALREALAGADWHRLDGGHNLLIEAPHALLAILLPSIAPAAQP